MNRVIVSPTVKVSVRSQSAPLVPFRYSRLLKSIAVASAVCAAAFVRWYGLGAQSLWWDEGYTAWFSQFPVQKIWSGLRTDTGPPLYYLLEHVWIYCFGTSETALRALSALFTTVSVPLFYLLARRTLRNNAAAITALWLFALSAFQVEYGQEARMYALAVFLSIASVYSGIVFLERRSILAFSCLALSVVAGLYTHNMALFYLPGLACLWLIYPSTLSAHRRLFLGAILSCIVLVAYAPWVPALLQQTKSVEQAFWIGRPKLGSIAESIAVLSGLQPQKFPGFEVNPNALTSFLNARAYHWGWAALFSMCVLGGIGSVKSADRRKTLSLLGYAVLPILIAFVVSRISRPVYLNRAFIGTAPILAILFAAPLAYYRDRGRLWFKFINGIALIAIAVSLFVFVRHFRKEDWRGATEYVSSVSGKPRTVLMAHDFGQILFDYYDRNNPHPFPKQAEGGLPGTFDFQQPSIPPLDGLTDEQLIRPLQEAGRSSKYEEIDVVFSHAPERLRRATLEYLTANCASIQERDFFGIAIERCFLHVDGQGKATARGSYANAVSAR